MRHLREFIFNKGRDFFKNKRGVSAVEFALILPVMVVIYLSTVEISMAVAAQRRVAIAAGTIGDLAAQYETMNSDNINIILNSTLAVLQPYDPDTMTVRVSSVVMDDNGNPTVDWSYLKHRESHQDSDPYADVEQDLADNVPADLRTANTSVIVANLDFTYKSPVGALLQGERHLTQTVYFRPRLGTKIPFESSTPPQQTWPLDPSGPDGTQINTTYVGFGMEYMLQPRDVERSNDGSSSTDSPPAVLTNAYDCNTEQSGCDHSAPGCQESSGGCTGGGGGGGWGGGCDHEERVTEVYLMPVCYSSKPETQY